MESASSYNGLVREHFESPRNTPCHAPGPGTVFGHAGDPMTGTQYRLSSRVAEGRLLDVRFEAYGCPHAIAAASLLTEQLTGTTVEEAFQWNWRSFSRTLDVPPEKRGRLLILEDALRSLIAAARADTAGP